MEDLDKTLDIMERDKCTALLAENSVRLKKNNIKYTKMNQKHSQEHLDNQFSSFERLIRTLIRQLVTIEKKIRLKYLVPLETERANRLMASWNTEVECVLLDLNKKYRDAHLQRGSVEEFDKNVEKVRADAKRKVDSEVVELKDKLEKEIGTSQKMQPSELSEIYGVDESVLIDLMIIDPLQNLHILFGELKKEGCDGNILEPISQIIKTYSKEIKNVESTVWSGRSADQRKTIKMRVAKLNINLKEIILSLQDLMKQALLVKEKRNGEIIDKIIRNLERIFKSEGDPEPFQNRLNAFLVVLK